MHANENLHAHQQVLRAGPAPADAAVTMIMVHGRGASAASILSLAQAIGRDQVSYIAPQAHASTWYPHSFLAPISANEPWLSSALQVLDGSLQKVVAEGVRYDRIVLLGFSQGACLSSEFVARNPRRYGGLVVLSGGLIGNADIQGSSPPHDKAFDYDGSLEGTPVFLGCSDVDPHIPLGRVKRSAEVLTALGGEVTERIYPGMAHTVIDDEIMYVQELLDGIAANESR